MTKKIDSDNTEKTTRAVKPVAASKSKAGASKYAEKSPKATGTTKKTHKPANEMPRAARRAAEAIAQGGEGGRAKPATSTQKATTQKPTSRARKPAAVSEEAPLAPILEAPTDEKLQKVLARAGIGSRREMERAIEAGKVKVNDRIAKLGDRVTPQDKIFVEGKRIVVREEATRRRVILYNKPEGEICSRSDPEGRPTVYDNLPPLKGERWISVGRLDFNTSGLLLFTNDGEFANKLMHPSSVIDREYLVRIQGEVDDEMKQHLLEGVLLDDGVARFTDIVDGAGEKRNRWFYCVVMEGRNREVRRLWESQGVKVSRLKRVRYANIFIPSHVRVGQWIELTEREIRDLCMTAGFESDNNTKIMQPNRDEQMQIIRHDKKLRSASSPPKRVKTVLRKRPTKE